MTHTSTGWERLSRRTGGTVAGLATARSNGGSLVFAATPVGVFCSSDAGRTWTLPERSSTVPLADVVAPSPGFAHDRTIFACAADGLYRSSDGGESWQRLLIGSRMLSVASSSRDGRQGLVVAGTEMDGVLRSEDGGRSWTGANAGLLDLTALALSLSPQVERDRLGFVGTASGLYRTRNGARSWRAVETGLDEPAVQCLAVSPSFAEDGLVLAGTESDGLLRSDDGGATWHRPPSLALGGVTAVAFSTSYPTRRVIAAATEEGVAVSHDGGQSWHTTGRMPGPMLSLIFVGHGARDVLLAGLHRQGVARSEDDGASWEFANEGLNATLLTGLLLSPAFARDRTLFVAGLHEGVSVSTDGGRTWVDRSDGLDDWAVSGLAVSPAYARDRTVYAATAAGIYVSRDAGATWQASSVTSASARAVATGPATRNEDAPPTVVAALVGGRLIASDDSARTWRSLGAAFDGAEVISLALSPGYARDRTLFVATTSGPAPGKSGQLVLWRSVDGGERWERWLVEREARVGVGVGVGESLMPLAVAPTYPIDELVFAGLGGRVLKPVRHAWEVRSRERRPVWRGVEVGRGTVAVTALAVSPSYVEDRTLFAATNAGVFVSRDGGDSFHAWSEDSENRTVPTRVVALGVSPSYRHDRLVYALGLGGSVWRRLT